MNEFGVLPARGPGRCLYLSPLLRSFEDFMPAELDLEPVTLHL